MNKLQMPTFRFGAKPKPELSPDDLTLNGKPPRRLSQRAHEPQRVRRVCILSEIEAGVYEHEKRIGPACELGVHRHYTRRQCEKLERSGEIRYVGVGKQRAVFTNARSWRKVYDRNEAGEVFSCGMQLVPGGGVYA